MKKKKGQKQTQNPPNEHDPNHTHGKSHRTSRVSEEKEEPENIDKTYDSGHAWMLLLLPSSTPPMPLPMPIS